MSSGKGCIKISFYFFINPSWYSQLLAAHWAVVTTSTWIASLQTWSKNGQVCWYRGERKCYWGREEGRFIWHVKKQGENVPALKRDLEWRLQEVWRRICTKWEGVVSFQGVCSISLSTYISRSLLLWKIQEGRLGKIYQVEECYKSQKLNRRKKIFINEVGKCKPTHLGNILL